METCKKRKSTDDISLIHGKDEQFCSSTHMEDNMELTQKYMEMAQYVDGTSHGDIWAQIGTSVAHPHTMLHVTIFCTVI